MAAPPLVERRVDMQPAKSVSAYTVMPRSPFCHGKWYTALGRCSRYLARRRSAAQSSSVGQDIRRQHSLVAKLRSGRSELR
eukprot:3378450-Alexandrium_andersonii.AAC.1